MSTITKGDESREKALLAALGPFFSALAHDLRTPLTVIRNAVSLIRPSSSKTPEIAELRDMIDAAGDETNVILGNLTAITESRQPNPGEVDLESLIGEVIDWIDSNRVMSWRLNLP